MVLYIMFCAAKRRKWNLILLCGMSQAGDQCYNIFCQGHGEIYQNYISIFLDQLFINHQQIYSRFVEYMKQKSSSDEAKASDAITECFDTLEK